METYARELIPALLRERPDIRLTAFVNREAAAQEGPWRELVPAVTVPVRARQRWQWVRGEQQLLPRLAKRAGVDLVHSLASTAPAWGAFRSVVTIQDVIYRRSTRRRITGSVPSACACWSRLRPGARTASSLPRGRRRTTSFVCSESLPRRSTSFRSGSELPPPPHVDHPSTSSAVVTTSAHDPSSSRSRRSARTRTSCAFSTPSRASPSRGARFSSCPATRRRTSKSYGSMRTVSASRPTRDSSAGSPTTSSKASTGVRRASSFRPSTRGSGSPSSRRWPEAYRSRARDEVRSRRSSTVPRSRSIPSSRGRSRTRSNGCSRTATSETRLRAAGHANVARFSWAETARGTLGVRARASS